MSASQKGIRKFMHWMAEVKRLGWPPNTWSKLADLWWEHHDDDGELK